MKREDFIVLLSLLVVLEGYLGNNLAPAVLGFSMAVYLLLVRLGVSISVSGEREIPESRLEENGEGEVRLKLRNSGNRVVVRVSHELEDFDVPDAPELSLEEGEERVVTYLIRPRGKGEFVIGPTRVTAEDERGLYFETFEVGGGERISVYPSLDSLKEAARADHNIRLAETYRKNQFIGTDGLEIKELREYQHGDDFKRIDWKASMRLGELIVRDMLKESDADVYILVDNTSEMRKGIRMAKVDYAATLTLQLATTLIKGYRVGLVIYDETGASIVRAGRGPAQLEAIRRKLNLRWKGGLMSLKFDLEVRLSENARRFLGKILPLKKGRRGSKGVFEGLSLIKQPSFLIFISDMSNPSDLYRAIALARRSHRVLLLSPNPVLFYSGELDRETLKRLYRAYVKREKLLRKFNALVPTIDLGPSDYIRELAKVI